MFHDVHHRTEHRASIMQNSEPLKFMNILFIILYFIQPNAKKALT